MQTIDNTALIAQLHVRRSPLRWLLDLFRRI